MTLADPMLPWFSVKEAVMPFVLRCRHNFGLRNAFNREVMGWDRNFGRAFLKAQMGAGMDLPKSGKVFFSIKDDDKTDEMKGRDKPSGTGFSDCCNLRDQQMVIRCWYPLKR